jgi:peptidylprolyl isomerase
MSLIRSLLIFALVIAALVLCAGCSQSASPVKTASDATALSPGTTASSVQALSTKNVLLETTMGNITIELDPDMPVTAGNFETLVAKGYYDGVIFHRVIPGFMIQGGDPTGTGRGGPGYTIQDEFSNHNKNSRGTVAMANTGQPDSGGSQFFINLVDNSARYPQFDTSYPVFGTVVDGMDVVDAIGSVQTGTGDRPLQNVTIVRAVLV